MCSPSPLGLLAVCALSWPITLLCVLFPYAGPNVPSQRGCPSCYMKVLAFPLIPFISKLQQKLTSTMYIGLLEPSSISRGIFLFGKPASSFPLPRECVSSILLLSLPFSLTCREIQQQALQQSSLPYPPSLLSSLTESPVLLPCLVVIFVALTLLICRHRRPHTSASSYCGLYSSSPVNDLLRSDSQISMSRNLSSRKLSMAIP